MTFLPAFLITIAAGAQRSLAATQYIPDGDTLVISTSIQPCSLIGDPDLYGLGVRVAFYISFGTSLIAILFGLYDELKVPRLSFNVLFASLLIILVRNVHQGSFAIFEWYIVNGLAFVSVGSAVFILPTEHGDDDDDDEDGDGKMKENSDKSVDDVAHAEAEAHMAGAIDPRLEAGADKATNDGKGHQTRDVEANPGDGDKEFDEEEEFSNMFASEKYRILLSGPVSLGFSYFLYGVFSLMQPWLYFTQMHSGHKEGCPVPFVFFGTFDMYNGHWQRWLKAQAALGILWSVLFLLPLAIFFITTGAATRKYRAAALRELDEKLDKRIKEANKVQKELEQDEQQQKEQEKKQKQPISPDNAHTQRLPEQGIGHEIKKIEEEVDQKGAKRWKWRIKGSQVKEVRGLTKQKRISAWVRRIPVVIFVGIFFGALPIYFIERTLQLNQVDLGSDLSNSSGQMLALLVAVFSSLGFVWQVVDNYIDGKKRRDELKHVLADLDHRIDKFIYTVDRQIEEKLGKLGELMGELSVRNWFRRRSPPQGHSGTTEALFEVVPGDR